MVALVLLIIIYVIFDTRHKSNQQTINDATPCVLLYPDSNTYSVSFMIDIFLVQVRPGEIGSMIRAIAYEMSSLILMCQYITL